MAKKNTLPNYIPDTPYGEDFFNIHSQISEMLYETISDSDVRDSSFTLGLLGSWGSGKSLTVHCLKKRIKPEDNILFFEFDVWKYVDSSLYRSILIDFERALSKKALYNLVPPLYKDGIHTTEGKNLHEVLYKSSQETSPKVRHENDWCSKKSREWKSKSRFYKIAEFLLLTPLCLLITTFKYIYSRSKLFFLLLGFGIVLSLSYYYRSNIEGFLPFLSDKYLKPIFKFLAFSVMGLSVIELLKESLKDFFNEMLPKTNNNVVITSPPTFAQDQFEDIFRDVIKEISDNGNKKIVIVFDNIDRCESKVTIQILTGLKTFLDHKNCFYLIPCDDQRIKDHINKKKEEEEDYLDKIFQACIRIPAIEGGDKFTFIKKCLEKADFKLASKSDEDKLIQILTLAYKADTPRQIKRFFNDFISYYRLATIVDPKHEMLLKDVGYFTLMVAIKQKWPKIEASMLENSNFFKEFDTIKEIEKYPKEATQFIEICLSWIDHEQDPANFIFLKNTNNSHNRIERILIQGQVEFEVTTSLIQQIEKFIFTLRNEKKFILFEASIESLKKIIEERKDKIDEHLMVLLFKIYFKAILAHRHYSNESKKETYFLSHANFISENIKLINKLDVNNIPSIQEGISLVIRANPTRSESVNLYNAIQEQFPNNKLEPVFKDLSYDEFQQFNQYLNSTKPETLHKILKIATLESLANSSNFNRDESVFVNFIYHLGKMPGIANTMGIISRKIYESLSQAQSHAALHPSDPFILKGMSILNEGSWEQGIIAAFETALNQRLAILFQHGIIDTATSYAIEGIRNNFKSPNSYFQPNGQYFDTNQNFTSFIDQIDAPALQIAMENEAIRSQLLRISSANGLQNKVLDKLNTEFVMLNIDSLIFDNVAWINELFKQYVNRSTLGAEIGKLEVFEKTVIEKYLTLPDLLFGQYVSIIPNIKSEINRDYYAEKAIEHFRANHKANAEHITAIINLLNINSEIVIGKIYNNAKIQLIEIDNKDLFTVLLNKLKDRDREDYLNRILGKISNDLKTPGLSKIILSSLNSSASSIDLQNKQRIIVEIIQELFEPSREEADNVLGLELFKTLGGSKNRTFDLDEKLKTLVENPNKSEQLKAELKNLV